MLENDDIKVPSDRVRTCVDFRDRCLRFVNQFYPVACHWLFHLIMFDKKINFFPQNCFLTTHQHWAFFFSRMFQNSSPNSNRFLVKLSGRTGLCKSYYRSFWFGLHQTSYFSILDLTNKFWIDLLILMQNTFSVYLRKWTLWADFMIHLLEQNTKT